MREHFSVVLSAIICTSARMFWMPWIWAARSRAELAAEWLTSAAWRAPASMSSTSAKASPTLVSRPRRKLVSPFDEPPWAWSRRRRISLASLAMALTLWPMRETSRWKSSMVAVSWGGQQAVHEGL